MKNKTLKILLFLLLTNQRYKRKIEVSENYSSPVRMYKKSIVFFLPPSLLWRHGWRQRCWDLLMIMLSHCTPVWDASLFFVSFKHLSYLFHAQPADNRAVWYKLNHVPSRFLYSSDFVSSGVCCTVPTCVIVPCRTNLVLYRRF